MTSIIIRTIGNRALYRSLYESIDSETHHRTVGGAVGRVLQINAASKRWSKSVGQWGTVKIAINGETLCLSDTMWLLYEDEPHTLADHWRSAIKEAEESAAKALKEENGQ